jgi:hypothetical protein
MVYFDHDEERLVRVERIFEGLTRRPAPPRPVARVVIATRPLGPVPPRPLAAKPRFY